MRVQLQSGSGQWGRKLLALAAVLLIALGAVVAVTHYHNDAGTTHADCALCLVAHTSVLAPAMLALPVPEQHFAEVEFFRPETPRITFVLSFYSRPPPAEAALS